MSEKLKSCPFCGGKETQFLFSKGTGDDHEYAYGGIYCRNDGCGGAMTFRFYNADEWTEEEAENECTEHWNRRTNNE